MDNPTNRLLIAYELDNAEGVKELDIVRASLDSVLTSAEDYLKSTADELCFVLLLPEGHNQSIFEMTQQSLALHPKIQFKTVSTKADAYFASKNSIAGLAKKEDIVVFCDSDCVYESTYLFKIVSAMRAEDAEIAYGKTYANLEGKGRFSRIAALAWQFPPLDIGYSIAWGNSRWANNFAVKGRTLSTNPFPVITLDKSNAPQIKIEGVLWQLETGTRSLKVIDTNASCSHHIFDSIWEFASRQFVHGAADVTFYKTQGRFPPLAPLSSLGFIKSKSVSLIRLFRAKSISQSELMLTLLLVWASTPVRIFGSVIYTPTKVKLLQGAESSHQADAAQ